jgi:phage/plasmid-like protein (TIGR03299 family)
MPAELSVTNNIYSFADSRARDGRVDAWHRCGTAVGHDMTAQEALEAGHLANWNVRKVPLWAELGEGLGTAEVPSRYGVVFDNPVTGKVQPMPATVGERYEHAQNEALAVFGEAMVDELGQSNWQTAGSLRGYTQVFLTMFLPSTMELMTRSGVDVTRFYFALLNSHDGSTAITGLITPVRIVCANTQSAAISSAVSSFKIRHTANWADALQEARRAIGLAFKYEEAFEAEVQRLYAMEMSNNEAMATAEKLVKLGDAEPGTRAYTMRSNTADALFDLFTTSDTIAGSIGGTRWGFYNAVTEYVDHYQGVRGAGGDEAGARAVRTITAAQSSIGLKADAWRILAN